MNGASHPRKHTLAVVEVMLSKMEVEMLIWELAIRPVQATGQAPLPLRNRTNTTSQHRINNPQGPLRKIISMARAITCPHLSQMLKALEPRRVTLHTHCLSVHRRHRKSLNRRGHIHCLLMKRLPSRTGQANPQIKCIPPTMEAFLISPKQAIPLHKVTVRHQRDTPRYRFMEVRPITRFLQLKWSIRTAVINRPRPELPEYQPR